MPPACLQHPLGHVLQVDRDRRSNKKSPQPCTYLTAVCLMVTAAAKAAVLSSECCIRKRVMKDQEWSLIYFTSGSLTSAISRAEQDKNETGTDRQREREGGCIVPLIPSVSNATVDKQKGLRERQGGEGIIRVLEGKRGTQLSIRISQSCHRDQKGKTNNNRGCSGEQITAFTAHASLYCQICGSLREKDE